MERWKASPTTPGDRKAAWYVGIADPTGDGATNLAVVRHRNGAESYAKRIAALPELEARHAKLRKAAERLANEVKALRAFELEVRDAIGNTNWRVMRDRLAEFEAAAKESP